MFSSGYGFTKIWLNTICTKTPFFTSENYRRKPEDIISSGDVREIANISIRDNTGIRITVNHLHFSVIDKFSGPNPNMVRRVYQSYKNSASCRRKQKE